MPFDAFVKIDGIDGESTDAKHKGEIEILSFSHGITQSVTSTASSTGSLSGQRCDMSPYAITKQLDKASTKIAQSCAAGDAVTSVIITLCRAGGDKQPYMKTTLTDVIISSINVGGSSQGDGGVPIEEVTFAYGKIEWEYTVIGLDNKPAGSVTGGWVLTENKKA